MNEITVGYTYHYQQLNKMHACSLCMTDIITKQHRPYLYASDPQAKGCPCDQSPVTLSILKHPTWLSDHPSQATKWLVKTGSAEHQGPEKTNIASWNGWTLHAVTIFCSFTSYHANTATLKIPWTLSIGQCIHTIFDATVCCINI